MPHVTFPLNDLSDLAKLVRDLPASNPDSHEAARARQDTLTKPPGSLGRLEDLAVFMAGWQGRAVPEIGKAQAIVFAGNHGICAQNVNPFPQAVTAQMVQNFKAGGAAINQICKVNGADLSVVDLELDRPTADFTQDAAMSPQDCVAALNAGAAAVASDADVLILGEMVSLMALGCSMISLNSSLAAYLKDHAFAAMVVRCNDPKEPGNVPLSKSFACSFLQNTMPLLAEQKVLVVDEDTKSA